MQRKILRAIGFQNKREALCFLLICSLIFILSNINHINAYLRTKPGYYFLGSGVYSSLSDVNAYMMRIIQGMRGSWTFAEWYTPENTPGNPLYIPYLALGHLANMLNITSIQAYHLGRFLSFPVLLLGLYALIGLFFQKKSTKYLVLIFATLPIGFNWLLINYPFINSDRVTEANTFLSLTFAPHFILGIALMCWTFWSFFHFYHKQDKKFLIALFCLIICQAFVYPFAIVPTYTTFVFYYLFHWLKNNNHDYSKKIKLLGLLIIPGSAIMFIYYYLTSSDIFLNNWWWDQQINYGFINPINLLLGFGFFGYLSFYLSFRIISQKQNINPFVLLNISWLWAELVCYYLPIPFAGRFIIGWQLPLVFLLCSQAIQLPKKYLNLFIAASLATAVLNTSFLIWENSSHQNTINENLTFQEFIYLNPEEVGALEWLKNNEPNPTVVLSNSIIIGNYIPVVAQQKTVLGQWSETYNIKQKKAEVYHFYATPHPDDYHQVLINRYNISYIYAGEAEKMPQGLVLEELPYLKKVYDQPPIQLYKVIN